MDIKMKPMSFTRHAIAYITLGFLCGWYYFILFLYPSLIYFCFKGSVAAGALFAIFITLSIIPLNHEPWEAFMYSWIWDIWREYFDMTYDRDSINDKLKKDQPYFFFEFPHGIFPMGQFLSASLIKEITPGKKICGTGADIVFKFPILRHIMAWIGTVPAKRENIHKVFQKGHYCAVIPGGIAEMYLVNSEKEEIFLKKRRNTVKTAIQEGAHIVPVFFFGNTKLFHVAGSRSSSSALARFSRYMKASVLFFYGRNYLPVPFRHPIHLVAADIVEVTKNANPSDKEIDDVMDRLVDSLNKMYKEKKPDWEKRPLVIT